MLGCEKGAECRVWGMECGVWGGI